MTEKLSKLAAFLPKMISKFLRIFRLQKNHGNDTESDHEDTNNNHSNIRARSKTPVQDFVKGLLKSPKKVHKLMPHIDDDSEMEEIYANQITETPKNIPKRAETPVQIPIPRAMSPVQEYFVSLTSI